MEKQKNKPVLRFPEFHEEWKLKKMGELSDRISIPVTVNEESYYEQIGIRSHGKGLFYKEPVTGKQLGNKRVYWIKENCLVVNIVFAWEQAVAKTTDKEIGKIASHRFPMFQSIPNQSNIEYLIKFFLTPKGKALLELASPGGAGRNKTLGQKEFENLKFLIPSWEEQTIMASFLCDVDNKLAQLKQKKTLLDQYKKGVMQKIFNQEIRFKDDGGNEYPEWEEKHLNELMSVSSKKNLQNKFTKDDVLSVSGEFGIVNQIRLLGRSYAGASVSNYPIVESGYIVYTKSPLKANPYGIIKFNKGKAGIVSTLYAVYRCGNDLNGQYLDYYFQLDDNPNRYLRPLVRKGAKNDMKISNEHFLTGKFFIGSVAEQTKIAHFLSAIDEKINACSKQIEKTEAYKKGLLQQMFV